jgi:hypothetical protein
MAASFEPSSWLSANGFNPDMDPQSASAEEIQILAFLSCSSGELDACRFFSKGRNLRIMRHGDSDSLMHVACRGGHINLCAWLLEDHKLCVREANAHGYTPFWLACARNHLPLAEWLLKSGAAGDIQTPSHRGVMPITIAMNRGHHRIASRLLRIGGASTASEAVNLDIFSSGHHTESFRGALRGSLVELLDERAAFVTTVLPVIAGGSSTAVLASPRSASGFPDDGHQPHCKRRAGNEGAPPLLSKLSGLEGAVGPLIAAFLGMAEGRELANVEAALRLLDDEIRVLKW